MKKKTTEEKTNGGDIDAHVILNCFRSNDTSISPAARVTEGKDMDGKSVSKEDVGESPPEVRLEPEATCKKQKSVKMKDKSKVDVYVDTFYKDAGLSAKSGKTAYIRNEYHARIQKLLRVVGKGETSLFSYLDNVIADHFSRFHDEIKEAYETNNSIF